jgi:hypothetical protein
MILIGAPPINCLTSRAQPASASPLDLNIRAQILLNQLAKPDIASEQAAVEEIHAPLTSSADEPGSDNSGRLLWDADPHTLANYRSLRAYR